MPSCSSSSSRSSDSYKDVKTMFIARDIHSGTLQHDHNHHHQQQRTCKPPIWTVAYSSAPLDHHSGSLYYDHATLNRQRNHNNVNLMMFNPGDIKSDQIHHVDVESSGFNAKRRLIFLCLFPVLFIAVFLAVYHVIHLQKDVFLVNSNAVKLGPMDLSNNNMLNSQENSNIVNTNNRNNRDSAKHFPLHNSTRISDLPNTSEYVIDGFKSQLASNGNHHNRLKERKIIEAQFRVSNKMYSRQLKNRTSDAFQKLSWLISEKIKLAINLSRSLVPLQLDKVELISVRKGDNLLYNLNGIIVDLILHFNRDVNCSLNEIVLNLMSAKKNGVFTGLDIDERTILFKFKSSTRTESTKISKTGSTTSSDNSDGSEVDGDQSADESDPEEPEHYQYKWDKWSDWGPTCKGESVSCDEERVHSRTRYCYDKLNQWRVDDINCIKVTRSQHQSLQIEDCVCEKTYKCLESEWQCLNTQCIPLSKRCDGHMNCFDSSDEKNCDCGENEIHCGQNTSCIAIEKKCNNITDCWDNSDEIDCPGYTDYD